MGPAAIAGRHLDWEGCFNVRDLGGLPTVDGGTTRRSAATPRRGRRIWPRCASRSTERGTGPSRDRAGQVTMLQLALAGVPAEVVAADYALSAERLIVDLLGRVDVAARLRLAPDDVTELRKRLVGD